VARTHDIAVVDGMLLRTIGPVTAPCLVMVHAFACCGMDFLPLFNTELADAYRLVAVDLPGFGGSPKQGGPGAIADHAIALAGLLEKLSQGKRAVVAAHSVGSMIAVEAIRQMEIGPAGLFTIEGNLTASDAYFSGKAADFDDPHEFKDAFLDELWRSGSAKPILKTYHADATLADAEAMWRLGCDARRMSVGDAPGQAYLSLRCPTQYYWSAENVPVETMTWIAASGISAIQFTGASHWPMIDIPAETSKEMRQFFDGCLGRR
jgi:pimeloyl-ACP methyl ester carboxylesterase